MSISVPDISVIEKVARSALVCLFLLVAFRLAGKCQLGQMTAFDLVVLLVISNVVQNALIGDDRSLGGGLLGATVILALNAVVAWATFRHKGIERLSLPELRAALRREGVISLRDVRCAILGENGHLSVIPRRPATP